MIHCLSSSLSLFSASSLAGAAGRRQSRRSAFTLIEVMVVVIVIGVLAGFVAPLLGDRRARAELVSAARAVAQAAQLGRQEAATTGREVRLVIGREAENAWALETDAELPEDPPVAVRRGAVGGGTLPAGIEFAGVEVATTDEDSPPDAVRFDPGGGSTPAVVRLAGEDAERAVIVHASGRVEVADGAAGPPAGRVDLDLE